MLFRVLCFRCLFILLYWDINRVVLSVENFSVVGVVDGLINLWNIMGSYFGGDRVGVVDGWEWILLMGSGGEDNCMVFGDGDWIVGW